MRMLKAINTSVLLGIGMTALANEKAHELTDRLIEKGEQCRQEGQSPLHNLQQRVETKKADMMTKRNECLKQVLKESNLVTKDHLTELEHNLKQEFAKLDKRLANLEKHLRKK